MPNEFNESEKNRHDEHRLPPDLAELESQLAGLGQASTSTLDRDELMFQSGYAAAMATKELCPTNSKNGFARWGWPALSGTLGSVAAVLAIMLWAAPVTPNDSQFASKPVEVVPQVVAVEPIEPSGMSNANDPFALATTNLIEAAISPYLESVFRMTPGKGSVFEIRNRRLAEIAFDEPERPRIRTRESRPHMEPLRATSFQNQQLWGQL